MSRLFALATAANPINPSAILYSDNDGENWTKVDVATDRNLTVPCLKWDWDLWANVGIFVFANDSSGNIYRLFSSDWGVSFIEENIISGLSPGTYVAATIDFLTTDPEVWLSNGSIYEYTGYPPAYHLQISIGAGINNLSSEFWIRFT